MSAEIVDLDSAKKARQEANKSFSFEEDLRENDGVRIQKAISILRKKSIRLDREKRRFHIYDWFSKSMRREEIQAQIDELDYEIACLKNIYTKCNIQPKYIDIAEQARQLAKSEQTRILNDKTSPENIKSAAYIITFKMEAFADEIEKALEITAETLVKCNPNNTG